MYEFNYHRAASVADAEAKLGQGDDPTLMAGGMTLIPTLKQRLAMPSDVVHLGGISDLAGISVEGDTLVISAMTTHDTVCLLYTSPSPRDRTRSRMPSSA